MNAEQTDSCREKVTLTWTDPETELTWTYTITDGQARVGGMNSPHTDESEHTYGEIVIPSNLGGCPVTSIGYRAFACCSGLSSVTIPDGVVSIGGKRFRVARILRLSR